MEFYNNGSKLYTLDKTTAANWGLTEATVTNLFKNIVDFTHETDLKAMLDGLAGLST